MTRFLFYISGGSNFDYEDPIHEGFTVNYSASFDSSLYLPEGGQLIEASDFIGDMNQLDFLKDVVNRYGLVLHPVQNTGEFKFRRLEALLNDRLTAEDWTSKLAEISGENYVSGYAKVNEANYQYPEEIVVPNNDGSMLIENENAESEKTMFSSPFEIPVANNSSIGGEPVYKIPIWSIGDPETVTVETELNNDEEIQDAYLKTDGEVYGGELFVASTITDGYFINWTTGAPQTNASYFASDFIAVEVGKDYTISGGGFAFLCLL